MEAAVNNGMCRCCASEGTFKDMKTTYHWMGDEEIYSDMLQECFDITLTMSQDGANGGICEVCITQLRNAANFKKQVQHTEEQFISQLEGKVFKGNVVKIEPSRDDDDELEADGGNTSDFSDPEYELPIKKEEVEEPKPKKRAAATRASTARAKKAKAEEGEPSTKRNTGDVVIKIEPVSSDLDSVQWDSQRGTSSVVLREWHVDVKQEVSETETDENHACCRHEHVSDVEPETATQDIAEVKKIKKQAIKSGIDAKDKKTDREKFNPKDIKKHLHNIRTVLLNSNATPIKSHNGTNYLCNFCTQEFLNPSELKEHTLGEHDDSVKKVFMDRCRLVGYIVKLDVTKLQCKVCSDRIDELEEFMEHLKTHDILMYTELKSHVLPFKFEGSPLRCMKCSTTFEHFKLLQEHMNLHYRNYICDICDAGFVNKRNFQTHRKRHKQGEFVCNFCTKVFDTVQKRTNHENSIHQGKKRSKCSICLEKFLSYDQKMKHMVSAHGHDPVILKCRVCELTFSDRRKLTTHIKKDHIKCICPQARNLMGRTKPRVAGICNAAI